MKKEIIIFVLGIIIGACLIGAYFMSIRNEIECSCPPLFFNHLEKDFNITGIMFTFDGRWWICQDKDKYYEKEIANVR